MATDPTNTVPFLDLLKEHWSVLSACVLGLVGLGKFKQEITTLSTRVDKIEETVDDWKTAIATMGNDIRWIRESITQKEKH